MWCVGWIRSAGFLLSFLPNIHSQGRKVQDGSSQSPAGHSRGAIGGGVLAWHGQGPAPDSCPPFLTHTPGGTRQERKDAWYLRPLLLRSAPLKSERNLFPLGAWGLLQWVEGLFRDAMEPLSTPPCLTYPPPPRSTCNPPCLCLIARVQMRYGPIETGREDGDLMPWAKRREGWNQRAASGVQCVSGAMRLRGGLAGRRGGHEVGTGEVGGGRWAATCCI